MWKLLPKDGKIAPKSPWGKDLGGTEWVSDRFLTTLLGLTRIVGRGKVTQSYIKLLKLVSTNYFLFQLR
jgi:hypothetical protein